MLSIHKNRRKRRRCAVKNISRSSLKVHFSQFVHTKKGEKARKTAKKRAFEKYKTCSSPVFRISHFCEDFVILCYFHGKFTVKRPDLPSKSIKKCPEFQTVVRKTGHFFSPEFTFSSLLSSLFRTSSSETYKTLVSRPYSEIFSRNEKSRACTRGFLHSEGFPHEWKFKYPFLKFSCF